jgi:AraC-like DNA-binding protein
MREEKLLYHDIFGPEDKIYISHNITRGYAQNYRHFHSKYELTIVTSTNGNSIFSDGRTYCCHKPHIRLHKPFSFHISSVADDEIYERYVIYFTEKSIEALSGLIDIKQLYCENFSFAPLDSEALLCARHLAEAVLHGNMYANMQQAAFAGLLTLAMKFRIKPVNYAVNEESYIVKVLDYIDKNLSQKKFDKTLTAEEISKQFYISAQKLCADFKSYMNETLHHYLVSQKVAIAARLIARGCSPNIAAFESGFVDESHFSKTFKSRIGLTPYQFKKRLISEIEYGRN